ncbi:metal-dependent hydrolase [Halococcus agarilyticus]|uniref:metal-dependent hydrolase n=1 Tax=Halococcus agarilyticus TaxID=1232219 RepID=UPI000A520896|nr:metal-dependent hydrolase [Halococcus agarilyticus]
MMATTHALAGMALAGVTVAIAPAYAPVAVAAAGVGGAFPDLDLYADHRKTLHFPTYYAVLAAAFAVVALLVPGPLTVGLAWFFVAAALHSAMDAFGGGLELRPWHATSERAVYDHYRDRWLRPRRWIRYDGAPEDLALAVGLGLVCLAIYPNSMDLVIAAIVGISAVYALFRKPMVWIAERLVDLLPATLLEHVPERFTEDLR